MPDNKYKFSPLGCAIFGSVIGFALTGVGLIEVKKLEKMMIGALVDSFIFPIGKGLLQEKEECALNELSSRLKENPTADVGENSN